MVATITRPRTLADQNRKITLLVDPVADLAKLDATTLNEGMGISCRATQADTRFTPTASDTISDPAVCEDSGATVPGKSNYEGSVGLFRYFDQENPGHADEEGDAAFTALRVKSTEVVIVERHVNKKWNEDWEAGDEYRAFRVQTDNWAPSDNQHEGHIKVTIPLTVQGAELNGVVSATGV